MTCPLCDCDLFPKPIGGAFIEGCPSCFGSFCPSDTLLVPIELSSHKTGPHSCPACRTEMLRGTMFKRRLTLDQCPKCEGVWFDAYEIDRLAELSGVAAAVGARGEPDAAEEAGRQVGTEAAAPMATASASNDRPPWRASAALFAVCSLYALLHLGGENHLLALNRTAINLLLSKNILPDRVFAPGELFASVLSAEAILLWCAMAALAPYILQRFFARAVPGEVRFIGLPPVGWGKHESPAAEPFADERFEAWSRSAEEFVVFGDKELLIKSLTSNGLEADWLETYHDKRLPKVWVLGFSLVLVSLVGSQFLQGGQRAIGLGLAVLAGAGCVAALAVVTFIIEPRLRRSNVNSRKELLLRWEARLARR